MTLLALFGRAYLQVALVALNVRYIASGRYLLAFTTGCAISGVWWLNAGAASRLEGLIPLLVYALGAGAGTVTGMWLGRPR